MLSSVVMSKPGAYTLGLVLFGGIWPALEDVFASGDAIPGKRGLVDSRILWEYHPICAEHVGSLGYVLSYADGYMHIMHIMHKPTTSKLRARAVCFASNALISVNMHCRFKSWGYYARPLTEKSLSVYNCQGNVTEVLRCPAAITAFTCYESHG
ncbi:hypothetical protein JB92DRAFT_1637539 [Gautieria morchelliformis]|nr:hypothetical protein JB92DRAFT_1637539 [Gautieria morchelliformis]